MVEIIVTIVLEVTKCLAPATGREISYLRKYKSNFQSLNAEVKKLKNKSASIQHTVDDAIRKGEEIEEYVQKWLERARKIIDEEAGKFIEDEETAAKKRCFKGLCPDLKTRHQLSKEALTQLEAIAALVKEAEGFGTISYRIIPKDPRLSNTNYVPFDSRISTMKNVLCALSNPDVNIIGIYGMGGIGKTTLAKEVLRQAAATKELFDRVVFAKVSHILQIKNIQGEIADQLGLPLSEESEPGRAAKLCERLKKEKILVILDDIWERLSLKKVGIPLGEGDKGCKVLLTARSEDVLSCNMNSQRNFSVDVLNDDEAWRLFKKMAGDDIEGVEFKPVATDVAKECAGLPIAIVTVASALRNKRLFVWKDALLQLRRPSSTKFKNIQKEAYLAVELSYNLLEDDELKNCFLLLGYSYITLVDDLLMYGVGLGLFEGINRMEEAQNRVRVLVNKLRASCMLLDDKNNVEDFIMHDVVRDVAISIASSDQHVFTTRDQQINQQEISKLMSPDENTPKSCNAIVLIDAEIPELPEVLDYPQLKLFSIRARDSSLKLSDNFFRTTTELRVLDLTYMNLLSPPSSLPLLTNLRTLCLYGCQLDNMAVIGELKKLKILFIQRSDIEQLPVELGELTQLKSLELRDCFRLQVIPSNVISRLSQLEELRTGSFTGWEVEELNNERRNASLDELKHLSNLTALQICIEDAKTLPGDLSFFKKLERYKILILPDPGFLEYTSEKTPPEICRKFKLELPNTNICLNDGHIMQLKGIEDLCLEGLQDMKNVLYGSDREGFLQLKYLDVRENPNLLCIVDSTSMEYETRNAFPLLESLSLVDLTNMDKICRGQVTSQSFCKLRQINVNSCDKLKNIFSFSVARGLQQLRSISVFRCQNVEEIFAVASEDESNSNSEVIDGILLNQLRSLELRFLPQLTSFFSESEQRRDVSTTYILFNQKVATPILEVLELYETKVERIWENQVAAMSCGIQTLTRLTISVCSNLKCLFSSSIASSFVRLQYLVICECPALEEIVIVDEGPGEEERKKVAFPQLEFLRIKGLKNLTKFCSGDYIEFPSLKELKIKECPKLKGFVVKDISTDLKENALFNEEVAFPSLEEMSVKHCDKLQILFPRNMYEKFQRLEFLTVKYCGSLGVIFDLEGPNFEKTHGTETQLSVLTIDGLPKLKHVWNKDPRKFLSFQKLKTVSIHNCDALRNVFPASVASSLSQLERLDISRSGVEEISFVSEEVAETNPRFVFPSVNSLTLHDLTNYKTFFPGIHTTEWPALKKLEVSGWEIVNITTQKPELVVEKVFPNLEELIVKGKGIATTIWQFPDDLLCKVKYLHFEFDESTVFPSLDFLQRFHNIKMLKIGGGIKYTSYIEVENGTSAWISHINRCSDLKQFLKEESNMDHLVDLELGACHNLVNLVPSSTSFQNLTTLKLSYCEKLTYIVTSSTAKSLVRLRRLSLFECDMITEIVAADEGDAAKDHEIVFSELKDLSLTCLKGLTSFCSGSCNFSFPSLEEIRVIKCPKMNIFSEAGELSTPKLHKVEQDWHDEVGCWKGDLNTTIQQLHEEMEEDEEEFGMWNDDEEEDAEGSECPEL